MNRDRPTEEQAADDDGGHVARSPDPRLIVGGDEVVRAAESRSPVEVSPPADVDRRPHHALQNSSRGPPPTLVTRKPGWPVTRGHPTPDITDQRRSRRSSRRSPRRCIPCATTTAPPTAATVLLLRLAASGMSGSFLFVGLHGGDDR